MIVNHVKQGEVHTRLNVDIIPPMAEVDLTWRVGDILKWNEGDVSDKIVQLIQAFGGRREREEITILVDFEPVTMTGVQAAQVMDTMHRMYQALLVERFKDSVEILDDSMIQETF